MEIKLISIQLVAQLINTIPTIIAAIGGDGLQKEMIIELVKQLDLKENIEIKDFVPDEGLIHFLNKGKNIDLTSEAEFR